MTLSDLPIRDDLRGKEPYGAPQAHLPVELNVNENTHPVPPEVQREVMGLLAEAVRGVNRYPDREFHELREHLADYLGRELGYALTPEQLWAANGSNEILQQLLQAFGGPGRSVMGYSPTYSMYPLLADGTGTRWIDADRESDYSLTPERAVGWVEREHPNIIILCTPNNPTGTAIGLDVVEAVYAASSGIVIVDEAYVEFQDRSLPSALTLLPGRERLVVSRTMSKAFAAAGLRLGYLAADPAVIDALRLVRLPYHLSALTQAAAIGALRHAPLMLHTVDDIRRQRDRIAERLSELGFVVHPSQSNFILFGGVDNPHALFSYLIERGIIIREMGIPGHLRVSAGTEQETTAFLAGVESYLAERA